MALRLCVRPVHIFFNGKCNKNTPTFMLKHQEVLSFKGLQVISRKMASTQAVTDIGCDELKKFQKDSTATIVDVRGLDEIQETGKLPGSVNIPLSDLSAALQANDNNFQKMYYIAKPLVDNPIVFSCRSGRRSFMASETAASLGYKRVFNYSGGWLDWEKNCGPK